MTTAHPNDVLRDARQRMARAFTLVEIMVTVALLSIIILGLVAMFNQTRRAFTSSLAQVDVLESGRGAADMIARDMEQMAPCYSPNAANFYVTYNNNYASLVTPLANPADQWTNIIDELFFMTPAPPNNGQWTGIGYRLMPSDEVNGIGTLYRCYMPGLSLTNQFAISNLANQYVNFGNVQYPASFNRIIDGVTYFRILAYKTNGTLITNGNFNTVKTIQVKPGRFQNQDYLYYFTSNAVPAYVEIELGILETAALERYRSLVPGTQAADTYLTSHPGAVHIFRQRVPIRNVDPATAYQ